LEPKAEHAVCDKCPLKSRSFAASTGPTDAKIAVVSRSPGYYEAIRGKSFSGPSGRILDHLLQIHGADRKEVFTTNAVLCQADGTEEGFGLALACCEPRLKAEIKNADTIIAAGREATYSILGVSNIGQNRGYPHFIQENGKQQRVIVTNNPAVVLRDDATYPELVRDFRLAIAPLPTPTLPKVRYTENIVEAREWVEQIIPTLTPGTLLASDLETRSEGGYHNRIVCAGFSTRPERAIVFGESVCYNNDFTQNYLRRLYEIDGVDYLWHNGKFDVKVLRRNGINARVDHDTMLISWCLDERPGDPDSGAGGHALEWLLKDELGWPNYEPPTVRQFKKDGILKDAKHRHDLYMYNGADTAGSVALFEVLKARAINDNVWERPYLLMLIRLSEALARVEMQGTLYDAEESCNILERVVWPKLRAQRAAMRELCGVSLLNPNSPKQVEKLLYEDWGLTHNLMRSRIETEGKRSTDQFVREEILKVGFGCNENVVHRDTFKLFVQTLDEFKELDKQRGTYLEGLVLKRHKDGRIYTEFKIHGTESGRLSGSKPNLQNITRTKEGLPNIRSAFVPDPGCVFISADLSQAELRTIAQLSGDGQLQSIYTDTARSLHREVAAQFYGEDYSYEQYVVAKNINFGVAYWQSAHSFAQMYHIPQEEAQKFIDFWWGRFPDVWDWTKKMEHFVLKKGEIQSPFGHKRRFYVIPQDQTGRIHVVKEGINFLPQNIAANITNWALCRFCEWLTQTDKWHLANPRITVHDSILVNCKIAHVPEMVAKLKECLEAAPQEALNLQFPYKAEFSVGNNWGQMEEYEVHDGG